MRKLLILISVFFLSGCGGGGGGGSTSIVEDPLPDGTEKMIAGQTYQVSPGDEVVKTSEGAQIKVTHIYDETNSTIELVEGDANIVRSQ